MWWLAVHAFFLLPGTVPNTFLAYRYHQGDLMLFIFPVNLAPCHSAWNTFSACHYETPSLTPSSSPWRKYTDSSSFAFPCAILIAWSAAYTLPLSSHPYFSCCFAIKFRILSLTLMSDLLVCLVIPWQVWYCLHLFLTDWGGKKNQVVPLRIPQYCFLRGCKQYHCVLFPFLITATKLLDTSVELSSQPRKWQVNFTFQRCTHFGGLGGR